MSRSLCQQYVRLSKYKMITWFKTCSVIFGHAIQSEFTYTFYKLGCVFPMVVVSIQPHTEFGQNEHREDASFFNISFISYDFRLQMHIFISRILGKRNQIVAHLLNIFWNVNLNNKITYPNQAKATAVGSRVDTQYNLVFYIRSYSNPFLMVKESKVDSKLILALTIDLLWFKSLKSSVDQKLRSTEPVRLTINLFCIFTEFKFYWSTPRVPLTLLNIWLLSMNYGPYSMAQFSSISA